MRQREWASALLSLGLGLLAGCERPGPTAILRDPTEVKVAFPLQSQVNDYEEFTGHTEAILSIDVRSRVTGYLNSRLFEEGGEVKEGDILYEIDDRPYRMEYDRASANVARAEAHLKRLEFDFQRSKKLFERGAIGKAEFDLVASDDAESRAMLTAARAQWDTAKLNLDFTKIRASMSGQISRTLVDPGNIIREEQTALTDIVAADELYVYFDLNGDMLSKLQGLIQDGRIQSVGGKEVPVMVGLSDEDRFSYQGVVNFADNKVDAATGTLRLRGTITNPKPWLLSPGLFVRIRLPIGENHPALLIPEEAIGSDQGRSFVYVVDANDEVVYRPVEVGSRFDDRIAIKQGIAANERIIVTGLQRVRPGSKVSPRMDQKPAPDAGKSTKKSV